MFIFCLIGTNIEVHTSSKPYKNFFKLLDLREVDREKKYEYIKGRYDFPLEQYKVGIVVFKKVFLEELNITSVFDYKKPIYIEV